MNDASLPLLNDEPTPADMGRAVVLHYAKITHLKADDSSAMAIAYLLADLMHLCKNNDLCFETCLRCARYHFEGET